MGSFTSAIFKSILLATLVCFLPACDALKDLAGISEPKKSDISADVFADDFMRECVALQTFGLNRAEVFDIFCAGNGVTSIAGLEQFPNLRTILMPANRLSNVDLSPFPNLQYLDLSANRLNQIDLSHNPLLLEVFLDLNGLSELDVSQNPGLKALVLSGNDLMQLDVSNNPELLELVLDKNKLSGDVSSGASAALNLRKNTKLINLNLFGNDISYIDVSKNKKLDILDLRKNALQEIDVSYNQNLTELRLNDNQLTAINLANNLILDELHIENNLLSEIFLPIGGKLRFIHLRNNLLACDNANCTGKNYFQLPTNTSLIRVDLSNNILENDDIDLAWNQSFTELFLADNKGIVGTFDLSLAKNLVELNLDGTGVTDFDFDSPEILGYNEFFTFFDMKVLSAIAAPLDTATKSLLDNFESNKHLHPFFNPDNPDLVRYAY